jgi:tetratricopeptide (TPR) repeat protein
MAALEWLELQAIRAGRREKDETIIDAALKRSLEQLRTLDEPIELIDRFLLLAAIVADFKRFRDVTAYEHELSELKYSKPLKAALADEERQIEKEQQKAMEILTLGRELLSDETHDQVKTRLRAALKPLLAASNDESDNGDRRIARRTLGHVFAETFEAALYDYMPKKRYDLAVASLELAAAAVPTYPNVEFELARALTMRGSTDAAFSALRRAVEKGFDDPDVIEEDDAFARIRKDEKFKRIVNEIREKHQSKAKTPS